MAQSAPQGQEEVAAGPPGLVGSREEVPYLPGQNSSARSARERLHSQTWPQPPGPVPRSDPQTTAGLWVSSNAFLCGEKEKAGKTWGAGPNPTTISERLVQDLLTLVGFGILWRIW